MSCTGCRLKAHKRCLGSRESDNLDIRAGMHEGDKFTCQACRSGIKGLKCEVCFKSSNDGAMMTELDDQSGSWIHHICGLLCDRYEVKDFHTMEFTASKSAPKAPDE